MNERRARHLLPLFALLAAGCLRSAEVDGGGATPDAGPHYADELISTQVGGAVDSCSTDLPDCATGTPQTGGCGANPALGPPDGVAFDMSGGNVLEVGFACDFITAQPGDGGDFIVYATVSGATGVVEVSQDGSTFTTVGVLNQSGGQPFSLSAADTDQAQFVQITCEAQQAGGTIGIDSVEAL